MQPERTDGVVAFDFTVNVGMDSHVFGFAADPDLGEPADDNAGYDANLGIAYAYDGNLAVGVIVLDFDGNKPAAIWQYGAGRFAPSDPSEIWAAQRSRGMHLLSGRRDVQFVLSASQAVGVRRYAVALITASSVSELQTRARGWLNR